MFVSFLLPKVDRGAGPLYHWVMLAQMARFSPDEVAFFGDADYFDEENIPFGETLQIGGLSIPCLDRESFLRYRKICLSDERLERLYSDNRNHLDVFRGLLTEVQSPMVECLREAVQALGEEAGHIEAFLTWCNCPSLVEVADALGVPVIHNELGPLRSPLYQDTVYFDFHGVNGGTTAAGWADTAGLREQLRGAELLDADRLRGLLVKDRIRVEQVGAREPSVELGVALQVQDDSNCIAFNRGWDELHLLYEAISSHSIEQVLVRSHPHARFVYRAGLGAVDGSRDSLEFLGKVVRLTAINSSLLAEAALWGVPFTAKGDCAFRCLAEDQPGGRVPDEERALWLNAFFVAYLVPAEALFDLDYYRWRLAAPRSLGELHRRHLQWLRVTAADGLPALRTGPQPAPPQGLAREAAHWTRTTSLRVRTNVAEREVSRLAGEVVRLTEEAQRLEQELKVERDWRGEAEKLWVEHEWLRNRVTELESALGREAGERAALDRQYQESDRSRQELDRRREELELALGREQGERRALDRQCQESDRQKQELECRRVELESALGREAGERIALDRQSQESDRQKQELERRREELESALGREAGERVASDRQRQECERQKQALERRLAELELALGKEMGERSMLDHQREESDRQRRELERRLVELESAVERCIGERDALDRQRQEADHRKLELERQLAALDERLRDMRLPLRDRLRGRLTYQSP